MLPSTVPLKPVSQRHGLSAHKVLGLGANAATPSNRKKEAIILKESVSLLVRMRVLGTKRHSVAGTAQRLWLRGCLGVVFYVLPAA